MCISAQKFPKKLKTKNKNDRMEVLNEPFKTDK